MENLAKLWPFFLHQSPDFGERERQEILQNQECVGLSGGRIQVGNQAKSWKKIWCPFFPPRPVLGGEEQGLDPNRVWSLEAARFGVIW